MFNFDKTKKLENRLLSKIQVTDNGCWNWIGAKFYKQYGRLYGQIRFGSKTKQAHRISYEFFVGKIPENLEIDHLCHNTLCINPEHLEAVTHKINMERRKDSNLPYCKRGHKYSKITTYIRPKDGKRECLICRKIRRPNRVDIS